MTMLKLDNRTVNDILSEIKKKSDFYTPEWNFDVENTDGGAALARIFAEMFYDTIDRYNRFPDKCYLEFLNMIDVCAKSVSSAVGMAGMTLVDGAENSVYVKKGTQLFTDLSDADNGEHRVVFETMSGFFATPAEIEAVFMTDPVRDIITKTILSDSDAFPVEVFHPDEKDNIEKHCFAVSHANVLRLTNLAEIRLRIENTEMSFLNETYLKMLSDEKFAHWKYFSGEGFSSLSASLKGNEIVLTKSDKKPFVATNENGIPADPEDESAETFPWIFCEMTAQKDFDEIVVDRIQLNSCGIPDEETQIGIVPDYIFTNDIELNPYNGGYCFGKDPNVYDCFYISCDEAFSKGGAQVSIEMNINTVILQDSELTDSETYEFNQKLLVDKTETKILPYDDIYVSEVVWEYWNGYGWAGLEVSGDRNPFSCQKQTMKKTVSFTCPKDFETSLQNAHESLWLRARISEVENQYSTRGKYLLPLMKNIDVHFDYGDVFLPAERISLTNNCESRLYQPETTKMAMRIYKLMAERQHALYLAFDKMPDGYPINLFFDFVGSTNVERYMTFEYLAGEPNGRSYWSELKVGDRTQNFENSGIISLYCPKNFCRASMFGQDGFWIRAVNRSMLFNPECSAYPKLRSITKNTVDIMQKQSIKAEMHEVFSGRASQTITLVNRPIISCDLWIDELPSTPLAQLQQLQSQSRENTRVVTDGNGQISEFWVKWEPKVSFADSDSDDRHYVLDATKGIISFGDGSNGKIPSYSDSATVSVDYSFGGGRIGNLPKNSLDGLLIGIPFVDEATNIIATCGGSDEQDLDVIRQIGTNRLKHNGRAVTTSDFESLVLEEFSEVAEVRCFANRNKDAVAENGFVTVVIMPRDFSSVSYNLLLCRRVEAFLSGCTSCELIKGRRFAVVAATPMKVSSEITVQVDDYEYAAEVEKEILKTVRLLLDPSAKNGNSKIGSTPTVTDFMTALKKIGHIAYISKIVLIGEYYKDNELVTVSLENNAEYMYLVATNGTHTIKL